MRSFMFIVPIIMILTFGGCGSDSNSIDENSSAVADVSSTEGDMEVAFAEKAGLLIAKSIGGKAGGMAMGEILKLLGVEGDGTQAELDSMKNMLDNITTELKTIGDELSNIETQLSIDTEKIIANINDPYDVLQAIDDSLHNFNDDINGFSLGELPLDKTCDISNRLLEKPSIKNQMRNIYTAVVTLDGVKKPVLTNYQELNFDKYNDGSQSLYAGYYNLESYTSELLYYQVQALNLTAEAYNTPHTVGTAECNYTEPQETATAVENYNTFRSDEVWNPDSDKNYSFIRNVWNYVLKSLKAKEIDDSSLSDEVNGILQRAEFYRRIIVQDSNQTGANLMVITTDKFTPDPYIYGDNIKLSPPVIKGKYTHKSYTVNGPAYPTWDWRLDSTDDEIKMSKSTTYNIWLYSFDENKTGKYYMGDMGGLMPEGNIEVKRYNHKYEQEDNGSVSFGLGLYTLSENSVHNPKTKDETTHATVTPHFSDTSIYRSLSGETNSNHDTYKGKTTYYIPFTYKGEDEDELHMEYDFHVNGKVETSPNAQYNASAKVNINVGIYDSTDDKIHHCMKTVTHSINSDAASSKTFDKVYSSKKCSLKLKKGNKYEYYIDTYIEGDGGGGAGYSKSWVHLHLPKEMHLSF